MRLGGEIELALLLFAYRLAMFVAEAVTCGVHLHEKIFDFLQHKSELNIYHGASHHFVQMSIQKPERVE